ncbi:PREDICTED: receptor like protein 30-like [Camelina sativa]|uniref:Receptor like protein 30-like n=1 Tax=Camelina sativa TaxID=90675 RepID=A0ABM0WB29_CAMSA|nr:PREDICTED: receptor like protein 30-like [Camelina sativa]
MDFVQIFKAFKAIDFSGNRFSGHIPGSIGLLSELRLLNLSGNAFTGNIPPSLAISHHHRHFSGEIPRGLGKLFSPPSTSPTIILKDWCHGAHSLEVKTVLRSWDVSGLFQTRGEFLLVIFVVRISLLRCGECVIECSI